VSLSTPWGGGIVTIGLRDPVPRRLTFAMGVIRRRRRHTSAVQTLIQVPRYRESCQTRSARVWASPDFAHTWLS